LGNTLNTITKRFSKWVSISNCKLI
jgi:hypothetical protein